MLSVFGWKTIRQEPAAGNTGSVPTFACYSNFNRSFATAAHVSSIAAHAIATIKKLLFMWFFFHVKYSKNSTGNQAVYLNSIISAIPVFILAAQRAFLVYVGRYLLVNIVQVYTIHTVPRVGF